MAKNGTIIPPKEMQKKGVVDRRKRNGCWTSPTDPHFTNVKQVIKTYSNIVFIN